MFRKWKLISEYNARITEISEYAITLEVKIGERFSNS